MNGIAQLAVIVSLDFAEYQDAFRLRNSYSLSFWDSLIVASALHSGCGTLYSEDMQHDLVVDGSLHIINPFQLDYALQ